MRTDTAQTIHLKDYQPHPFRIDETHLDVRLDPERTIVRNTLKIRPNPESNTRGAPLELDGEALELVAVRLNGEQLSADSYQIDGDRLVVDAAPDEEFELQIESICNPKANTALSGLYLSNGNYCTQCEAEGFRRITYGIDRPDMLSTYSVRIEGSKTDCPVLLANGNLVESGDIAGTDKHFAVWHDPFPKPSYLFALVAGDLACVEDSFTTRSGRDVTLRIFVEHGKQDRCDWAMESLKASMAWDEEAFGCEYDLDIFMIVAVSDFNMGAMENKGLNVFNDKYILALPETATDQDYINIEAIIAHEYFHNWTGNRITCRDWFQLCLKEGLTVFRDQEFTSDLRSRAVKRIADVRLLRSHQFPEDAGPLAHPVRPSSYVEINNFYTATVYEKGAEIVRMLKTLLGAEDFRKAMDLYLERHDGDAATVEDFVRCMAEVSGRDLSQFFLWYEQAGTPELSADGNWDASTATYNLTINQSQAETPGQAAKAPLHIPLRVALLSQAGEDMAASDGAERLLELTERSQTFRFDGITERPRLSLNRGFSAPIKLSSGLSGEDRLFLVAHDTDPFNRWDVTQRVARDLILKTMSAIKAGQARPATRDFAQALKSAVTDNSTDADFRALMLALPGETDLAGDVGRDVDPQLIHDAREAVRSSVGAELFEELLEIWNKHEIAGPYRPDTESVARRSFRHAALALLVAGRPEAGIELAMKHFSQAQNMTEKSAALSTLCLTDTVERAQALQTFYEDHRDDHLIVDKWLSFQAIWPHPDCVGQVRELMTHDVFDLTRPNRVRALIGVFAAQNPVCFNAADGSGYDLVQEVVSELDTINPQVAARLSASFKSWRVLESGRRNLAKKALELISNKPGLSKDTGEIVERCLA